jgi:DNA-binding winged helix-turn-helix (wHTH) protein/class 3 adenylate cyclase
MTGRLVAFSVVYPALIIRLGVKPDESVMMSCDSPGAIRLPVVAWWNDAHDISQRGQAMIHAFGEWELDIEVYELRYLGNPVRLEPQVFDVLAYLVRHRDRVISKQELMSHLWPDQFIGDSALERCIMAARKAVGDSGGKQQVIKTFHRRGYRFVMAVTERPTRPLPPVADAGAAFPGAGGSDAAASGHLAEGGWPERLAPPPPERQQATVLSCSLAAAPEPEACGAPLERQVLLAGLFDRATRQMQGYGGLITQFMNDGFLALFGVTKPCDGHALRAVEAALALQTLLGEETVKREWPAASLAVRMGLHTGEVIGKRFGEDPRVIYMAVGNTMQFAANLQACAEPGSVLVSGITYGLVHEAVQAEVVGLTAVHADAAPVAAYRLERMGLKRGPHAPHRYETYCR